jgi:hypothetical protein
MQGSALNRDHPAKREDEHGDVLDRACSGPGGAAERLAPERDRRGRFAPGNPYRWASGESGNPGGRPKGASFAAALARQALAPVSDREEMAQICRTIGLDPEEARDIDVVAALFYVVLCRSLLRASGPNGRADERLVGMLHVLLKALDSSELRISGPDGGPIPIASVIANVQTALGMQDTEAPPAVEQDAGHESLPSQPG